MKLTTTARHFETSPELLDHTEKRLIKLKSTQSHNYILAVKASPGKLPPS